MVVIAQHFEQILMAAITIISAHFQPNAARFPTKRAKANLNVLTH